MVIAVTGRANHPFCRPALEPGKPDGWPYRRMPAGRRFPALPCNPEGSEDMQRPVAEPTKHVENDRTRVIEWRFAVDAHTGWHKHEHDYVIVPMDDEPFAFSLALTKVGASAANQVTGSRGSHFRGNEGMCAKGKS